MNQGLKTNFPDEAYLQDLTEQIRQKFEQYNGPLEQLLMYSGAVLNWVGEFITDPSVQWAREEVEVEKLYLTGMGPLENKFVIDQAEHSPIVLREILHRDAEARQLFEQMSFNPKPILIRVDDSKLKVLYGMHRAIGAIKENRQTITAFVARLTDAPRPQCEPHVVYDLLRAFDRGINSDQAGLVTALRYLRQSYANVDQLLRERFGSGWIHDPKLKEVIDQALAD
jgi:hypothetical protein